MNKSSGFLPVKRRSLEVSDRDYKKLGEKNKFDTRELNLRPLLKDFRHLEGNLG
jgi:hypothetical protein